MSATIVCDDSIAGIGKDLEFDLPRVKFNGQPWLNTIGCPLPCSV